MNEGFTIKEAGAALGINPHKVMQSVRPAAIKIMRLLLADPAKTVRLLNAALDTIEADKDLGPIKKALAFHNRNRPATIATPRQP